MRIRQIKPSFWTDSRVAVLSPAVRLTYIGLWMLADDAGYYRWDPAEASNELYGYQARGRREREIAAHLDALVDAGRVERFPDCAHILIGTLPKYQRVAANRRVFMYETEHSRCMQRSSAEISGEPRNIQRERNVTERNGTGTERNGKTRERDEEKTTSDFKEKVGWAP